MIYRSDALRRDKRAPRGTGEGEAGEDDKGREGVRPHGEEAAKDT